MNCTGCSFYCEIEDDIIPVCNWYPDTPDPFSPCEEEDYTEENYMEENENER